MVFAAERPIKAIPPTKICARSAAQMRCEGLRSAEHRPPWSTSRKDAGGLHQELTDGGLGSRPEAHIVSFGSLSFYDQNRNWQITQQRWSDALGSANAVNSALSNALTAQSAGLAAISNHKALQRVTAQLKAAASSALGPSFTSQLNATTKSLKGTQSSAAAGSSVNLLA
jgi:hypothetical protein